MSTDAPLRLAVIGLGDMGRFHLQAFRSLAPWVQISAIADPHGPLVDQSLAPGAATFGDPFECLDSGVVDAAVVATADPTHYDLVRACLDRGIPVLCEKPLTTSPQHSLDLVRAEEDCGRRLVRVGFMRRHDASYRQMKRSFGRAGAPMLVRHRNHNPSRAIDFDVTKLIASSATHDIDLFRWFTAEEVAEVSCDVKESQGGEAVVVLLRLRSTTGILGLSEIGRGPGFRYDIDCEIVAAAGSISLGVPSQLTRADGGADAGTFLPQNWIERFDDAYRAQNVDWATSLARQCVTGPSAYDGYANNAVVHAALRALETGQTIEVTQVPPGPLHDDRAS
ncbi:MAG: Gfo/Idh/MocA family oxidoreductase [Mycobacterium sp.]|uniref:Gfo/Idh/MocA family protein n=1 Tax=Mycobacterium sp. TaxID=1785 RepID=UPI001ED170C6|nr:Gfo/Idh/MocA family oxidoreductase [Mycobacterium sp.]MBW0018872.1 Gfo/Idh/MocA family oxidoreductase [Mycobacterium sp.]